MPVEPARLYALLHAYCASRPGAKGLRLGQEDVFKARGRVFAFLSPPVAARMTVRIRRDERRRLLADHSVQRPRWIGWLGWVTVEVQDAESLIRAIQLAQESHRLAGKADSAG